MKFKSMVAVPVTAVLVVTTTMPTMAATDVEKQAHAEKIIYSSQNVLEEILSDPKTQIPSELLEQSEGIAIFPGVIQAGFLFGARRGTGVMMLRQEDGTWSNPAFINITGVVLVSKLGLNPAILSWCSPTAARSMKYFPNLSISAVVSQGRLAPWGQQRLIPPKITASHRF